VAPGYWLKLGDWENPTNLEGGYIKLGYAVNKAIQIHLGGDMYEGARNRVGYLTADDRVDRVTAGINFKLNRQWNLTGDYEGVFYKLGPNSFDPNTDPIEQYITLGAGVNLSSNTVLKFAYQIIGWNNVGGATNALGLGTGTTSNASVLTTQLAVHF